MKVLLKILAVVHKICPLCVISRRYPQSSFAKAVFAWGKICPFCSIYRVAKRKGLT